MFKLTNYTSSYRAKLIYETYKGWIGKKDRLLDVGCGTGIIAEKLGKYFDCYINGCDVKNYLITDISFKKMPTKTRLPIYKYRFDAVLFNDTLHHTTYPNQINLIIQAVKMSKSVLLFELKPSFVNKVFDYSINKIHYKNLPVPYTYRSDEEWENLFRTLNLSFEKREVKRPFLYPFSHVSYKVY